MNFSLNKVDDVSGLECSIYAVTPDGETEDMLTKFVKENVDTYEEEIRNLLARLKVIGDEHGARKYYFKHEQGKPGDGVCYLHGDPRTRLRLYCIYIDMDTLIMGDGGFKPHGIRSLQEDDVLNEANQYMCDLSREYTQRLKDGDITYSGNDIIMHQI